MIKKKSSEVMVKRSQRKREKEKKKGKLEEQKTIADHLSCSVTVHKFLSASLGYCFV